MKTNWKVSHFFIYVPRAHHGFKNRMLLQQTRHLVGLAWKRPGNAQVLIWFIYFHPDGDSRALYRFFHLEVEIMDGRHSYLIPACCVRGKHAVGNVFSLLNAVFLIIRMYIGSTNELEVHQNRHSYIRTWLFDNMPSPKSLISYRKKWWQAKW